MDPMQDFNEMYWTTLTPEQKAEYNRMQQDKQQAARRALFTILAVLGALMLFVALACSIIFFFLQHVSLGSLVA